MLFAQAALVLLLAGGCADHSGQSDIHIPAKHTPRTPDDPGFAQAAASSRTAGRGPRYTPPPRGTAVARASSVGDMGCRRRSPVVSAAHIELFAYEHVVIVPAGIGLSPPLRTRGALVNGERCAYPLRTLDPTGLVLLAGSRAYNLGDLFDLWGQALDRTRMAGFHAPTHGRVLVYVDGKSWREDPRSAPLAPHAEITIELGGYVPPHARYAFPSLAWASS